MNVETSISVIEITVHLEYERPPYIKENAYSWGEPSERAMDRLSKEYDHPRLHGTCEHPMNTYVEFQYENVEEMLEHLGADRKWVEERWAQLMKEEIAEEARLIKDRELYDEAEELDFLVAEALG